MAERKATNKYYPPEWEPKHGSINKFRNSHPLRARAKKIDEGILVVRFEMPYHVWCNGCERMIAKGVRFNAEKKAIGNYFSTKIFEFSMKCASCSHRILIKNDPEKTDFTIIEGARKKIEEFSAEDAGTMELMDKEEKNKLEEDPMFRLEHGVKDEEVARTVEAPRLEQIIEAKKASIHDYAANKVLRQKFRENKKQQIAKEVEADRYGVMLPDQLSEEDAKFVNTIKFGQGMNKSTFSQNRDIKRMKIATESIFGNGVIKGSEVKRNAFIKQQRFGIDPRKLRPGREATEAPRHLTLMRKKNEETMPTGSKRPAAVSVGLVQYGGSSSEED